MVVVILLGILIILYLEKNKDYKAGAYYQITKVPFFYIKRDLGRYGEYLIYENLKFFEQNGAKFLFNVYIPKQNGEKTEIDVLMISKRGIFIFESKNYSGWIFGSENQKYWYQTLATGRGRSRKEHFYNPIMQNSSHIKHLKSLVGNQIIMHSIIVFSDRCTLKRITVWNNDIRVIKRNQASYIVSNIYQDVLKDVLTENDIIDIYNKLYPYTQISNIERNRHIANIQNKKAAESIRAFNIMNDEVKNGRCPRCGGILVLRTATRGANAGNRFLGCCNYPKCRYTRNI